MIIKPIQVKVLSETSSKVLIYMPNSNSRMRVDKEVFNKNLKRGLYVIVADQKEEVV